MCRAPWLVLLFGLTAPGCSMVFDVGGPEEDVTLLAPLGGDPGAATAPRVSVVVTPETCNGVDDDGDGAVDEGYADTDGDGIADCAEGVCPALDVGSAGEIPTVAACEGGSPAVVDGPWAARTAWSRTWTGGESILGGFAVPMVASVDDDNGDGAVDEHDLPDVVLQSAAPNASGGYRQPGTLLVLEGRGGGEVWRFTEGGAGDGTLIADVDGDGRRDVVTAGLEGAPLALTGDGERLWEAVPDGTYTQLRPPIVADLDEDGRPELIQGRSVYDAATGVLRFTMDEPWGSSAGIAAVADADLDGHQEIYYQGVAWASDGTRLWAADDDGAGGLWPLIVQADTDQRAEIVWVGHRVSVWSADGVLLAASSAVRLAQPGAPCAGDLDDDGRTEVAVSDGEHLYAFELDGQLRWDAPFHTTNRAGCTTFDLDGDRAAEVLYADGTALRVLDGRLGQDRLAIAAPIHPSWGSYPVVADLDLDGHAEIVLAGQDDRGQAAVSVFAHDGPGWASAGASWPAYDYAVGNLGADGTIPKNPGVWWEEFGAYRGRPAGDLVARPDLTVEITDVCVADCTFGPVQVAVQVANQGGRDQYAGGRLVLYAIGGEGEREVASVTLASIPEGEALAGITFDLSPADLGSFGWKAAVVDDGSDADFLPDCEPANQVDVWSDLECPE